MKWIFASFVVIILIGAGLYFSATSNNPGTAQTATTPEIIPGVENKTYTSTDPNLAFTIEYPATASSSEVDYTGYLPLTQHSIASFTLPRSMFEGTNLGEAGVYIGANSSASVVKNCTLAQTNSGEKAQGIATINGTTFNVFASTGVGAGNIYDETIYRTVARDACIEIVELLHSGNIGNYPPGSVTQFDRAKFKGYLDGMLNTLQFSSAK